MGRKNIAQEIFNIVYENEELAGLTNSELSVEFDCSIRTIEKVRVLLREEQEIKLESHSDKYKLLFRA